MKEFVYVITKARPLDYEAYVAVKKTFKDAEKYIRACFPNARKDELDPSGSVSFLCRGNFELAGTGIPTKTKEDFLMFIHKVEL